LYFIIDNIVSDIKDISETCWKKYFINFIILNILFIYNFLIY